MTFTDTTGDSSLTSTVLAPFVEASILGDSEIAMTATFERIARRQGHQPALNVLLGLAVAARGPRSGHVCIVLDEVAELLVDERNEHAALPWPDVDEWIAELTSDGVLVATPDTATNEPLCPLVLDGSRLYLQRYWVYEQRVASDFLGRTAGTSALGWAPEAIAAALDTYFGPVDPNLDRGADPDWQRTGAEVALRSPFAVLAGGPGTGKTRTVARMLAAAHTLALAEGRNLHVALAAPSGKAAARMSEAIEGAVAQLHSESLIDDRLAELLLGSKATTIHKLLGAHPHRGMSRNERSPVPHDIVIIDETSMVSLPLMANLLAAVRPSTHLVLVGDPDQLASVEAGTVMGDVVGPSVDDPTTGGAGTSPAVGPIAHSITVLRVARRFAADSGIAALATAIRRGDSDAALTLLCEERDDVAWIHSETDPRFAGLVTHVVDEAERGIRHARAGEVDDALAALTATKVLSGTRRHPLGLDDWTERIERGLAARVDDLRLFQRWYVGRPIIVTANDTLTQVANGDVGVTMDRGGIATVVFDGLPGERIEVQAARLDQLETWWAMTIHKSQGSEFDHTIVSLPPAWVPILTRELLYTGVTRAKHKVTVIGPEESIRAAIERPVSRASGLRDRLWPTT